MQTNLKEITSQVGEVGRPLTVGEAIFYSIIAILLALMNPLVWIGLGIIMYGIYMITH